MIRITIVILSRWGVFGTQISYFPRQYKRYIDSIQGASAAAIFSQEPNLVVKSELICPPIYLIPSAGCYHND